MAEMERVVAAMRKVVERLQSENESLRKSAAKPRGTGMAQLEAENKKLKVCVFKSCVWLEKLILIMRGDMLNLFSLSLSSSHLVCVV